MDSTLVTLNKLAKVLRIQSEKERAYASRMAEGGFLHGKSEHDLMADIYDTARGLVLIRIDEAEEDEIVSTYPVSDSVLIEDIAKHNYDFTTNSLSGGSHWLDLMDEDKALWVDEATELFNMLRFKGWTKPTI